MRNIEIRIWQMESLEDSSLWSAPSYFTDGWFPLSNRKYFSQIFVQISPKLINNILHGLSESFHICGIIDNLFKRFWYPATTKKHTIYKCIDPEIQDSPI